MIRSNNVTVFADQILTSSEKTIVKNKLGITDFSGWEVKFIQPNAEISCAEVVALRDAKKLVVIAASVNGDSYGTSPLFLPCLINTSKCVWHGLASMQILNDRETIPFGTYELNNTAWTYQLDYAITEYNNNFVSVSHEQYFSEEEKQMAKDNMGVEDNVFIARYGTTTNAEILSARNAGKSVWLLGHPEKIYMPIPLTYWTDFDVFQYRLGTYNYYASCTNNEWTNSSTQNNPFSKTVTNATLHTSYTCYGSKVLYTLPTATYDRYIDLNLSGCIQADGTTAGASNAYVVNVNITRNGVQDTTLARNIYIDKLSSAGGVSNENFNLIWKVKVPANEAFLVNTVGANYGTGLNSVYLINVRQSMSEERA